MAKVNDVLNQARAWVGRREYDGSFKEIIDIYNAHKPLAQGYVVKYHDEWCSTFVSAVAIKAGATDIIPTECGCERHINLFKNLGVWIEDESITPQPGDIIFFDWNDNGIGDNTGFSDHVGFVESVSGNTITTIEGNYNESVARRTLTVNGTYIRGYARPKYSETANSTPNDTINYDYDAIAREVIEGKWGNGQDRKANLILAGYNPEKVQSKVNEILEAKKSNHQVALEVIRGDWGNGLDRRVNLTNSGYDYDAIQAIVNTL